MNVYGPIQYPGSAPSPQAVLIWPHTLDDRISQREGEVCGASGGEYHLKRLVRRLVGLTREHESRQRWMTRPAGRFALETSGGPS